MSRQEKQFHETALHSPPRDGQAFVEPPTAPTAHRTWDELLAATITALTAAARLQLPARDPNGREESTTDETRTEPIDWAEFVTLALTGAVANLGGVSRALRGRPGSWEAESLRGLLQGAVGNDPVTLLRHRTEPLLVVLRPAEMLADLGYDAVYDESQRLLSEQQHQQVWRYQMQDDRHWQPLDVDAPPYEAPAYEYARPGDVMAVPRSPRHEREYDRLLDLEARTDDLRYDTDPGDYGRALQTTLQANAAELYPGVPVEIRVDLHETDLTVDELDDTVGPAEVLIDAARATTRLPWSGLRPTDYPLERIVDLERAAGRLPHQRLT